MADNHPPKGTLTVDEPPIISDCPSTGTLATSAIQATAAHQHQALLSASGPSSRPQDAARLVKYLHQDSVTLSRPEQNEHGEAGFDAANDFATAELVDLGFPVEVCQVRPLFFPMFSADHSLFPFLQTHLSIVETQFRQYLDENDIPTSERRGRFYAPFSGHLSAGEDNVEAMALVLIPLRFKASQERLGTGR